MPISDDRRVFTSVRLLTLSTTLLAATAIPDQPIISGASRATAAGVATPSGTRPEFDADLGHPHVLETLVADVIVRVWGSRACSGTPLTGRTEFVVTAAHCVLDADGAVAGYTTVQRDGVEYTPVSVLVNPEYHNSPTALLDAAVLVMGQVMPGPSATLADRFPTEGLVTVAGLQPLDTDGSLLRGTRWNNRPLPHGLPKHGIIKIVTATAGCVHLASDAEITANHVEVPCGLIPGASGGGLFVEHNDELILAGIISSVAGDLTYNGLVPLTALHQLLQHPDRYTHDLTATPDTTSRRSVVRS
jgi:Trypsin